MISRVTTSSSTTVNVNGASYSCDKTHPFYTEILEEMTHVRPDEAYILSLLNVKKKIESQVFGRVTISEESVFYDGKPVGNALTKRIIDMLSQGYDITPWGLFMDNVMLNPVITAREELYRFLECASMPITPDGCFLAFKKVRDDLTSFHDGKTKHTLGKLMSLPMKDVDNDYRNQCSSGFHFCSESYLSKYHGGKGVTIVVKINPKNVVAIPSDYSSAKGRAWCYTPIAVIGAEAEAKDALFSKPIVGQVKGVDTFDDVRLKETRKDKSSKVKFNGVSAKEFMKAVTREGGARPYARYYDLPKSTVQDWVKKAKEVIGG